MSAAMEQWFVTLPAEAKAQLNNALISTLENRMLESQLIKDAASKFTLDPTMLSCSLNELVACGVVERYHHQGEVWVNPANQAAQSELVVIPELLPAVSGDNVDDVPDMSPREASGELQVLRRADLGFELLPWEEGSTAAKVRELHRSMLTSWLETGAYLYRARLVLGRQFWIWFDRQHFPFGRRWGRQAIQTLRMVLHDPELPKLVRKMQSIKAFRVVAQRLATPEGKAELAEAGTILGRMPEELGSMSERAVLEASKQAQAAAQGTEQLTLLPDEAVRQEREMLQKALQASEQALTLERQKRVELADELATARQQIARSADPDLNGAAISKDFLTELEQWRGELLARLEHLRPSRRQELLGLSEPALVQFYSTLLLVEKELHLVCREVETRFGARVPELLLDSEGNARSALSRAELRVLEEVVQQEYQALSKKAFTVIKGSTGEILAEIH